MIFLQWLMSFTVIITNNISIIVTHISQGSRPWAPCKSSGTCPCRSTCRLPCPPPRHCRCRRRRSIGRGSRSRAYRGLWTKAWRRCWCCHGRGKGLWSLLPSGWTWGCSWCWLFRPPRRTPYWHLQLRIKRFLCVISLFQ